MGLEPGACMGSEMGWLEESLKPTCFPFRMLPGYARGIVELGFALLGLTLLGVVLVTWLKDLSTLASFSNRVSMRLSPVQST